jgi:DNA-binding beta-propeller fold protein YncE
LHILPDLVRLEAKYPGVLVIIGVHSPKFFHEKSDAAIRKAILRYRVDHPVANDANLVMWRRYNVGFWPTFVLIDPAGRLYGKVNGEGLYNLLDHHIGKIAKQFAGRLNKKPLHFALEREKIKSSLFFPGKVLADAVSNRLFIADSTNNRIVITDLEGKKIAIAGTGKEGKIDGPFAQATFADPQGMALDGNTLYVADRKNHSIRALDLKSQMVKTIAGTGRQERKPRSGAARSVGLNSPWDLLLHNHHLYIAMAGHHQIWAMDLKSHRIFPFAGNGDEELRDGLPRAACFAQPSGLATDGRNLYVADSESSAIRVLPFGGAGPVQTIVGQGLMIFGDRDGQGPQVLLQHPLGVSLLGGKLYVADTYNSKIKVIDPLQRSCATFLGDKAGGILDEPGGLSIAGSKMYIADTGAHRIRVVDLQTRNITTLQLQGVPPVQLPAAATTSR